MDWAYGIRKLLEERSSADTQQTAHDFSDLSQACIGGGGDTASNRESRGQPKGSLKIRRHRLYVDGPYGTSSAMVFEFKVMILVAAGVGVTPFASILKTLAFQAKNGVLETPLKKVAFFWTCRDQSEFNSFRDILVNSIMTLPPSSRVGAWLRRAS
eukprot:scaffold3743_cov120-Isochrysis_galbana.AAC.1